MVICWRKGKGEGNNMNTAKIYYDSDGNKKTIHQMVKDEPDWAANRIQEGENAIELNKEMLEEIISDFVVINSIIELSFNDIRANQNKILLRKLNVIEKATGKTIEEVLNES